MKSWLYATSFKTRIWLSFIILVTVSLTISGLISHYVASNILERKAMELSQNMINKSAQALEEKLRKVRLSALTFTMNEPFNKLTDVIQNQTELSEYERYSLTDAMQNAMFQMKLIEPSISSVLLETPVGEFYLESDKRITEVRPDLDLFSRLTDNRRMPIWMETHEDHYFEGGARVLTLLSKPVSSSAPKGIYLLVNVKEEVLRTYMMDNIGPDSGEMIVYNESGTLALDMSSSLKEIALQPDFRARMMLERGHFEYEYNGISYMINYAEVSFPDNWMIVNIQSLERLQKEISLIKWITAGTVLVFGLFTSFFAKKITGLLLRPLSKLQQLMKRVEHNDLAVRYESHFQDEFAQVGQRFNRMLEEIETLIVDVKEAETNKRKAEMKTLQSQIEPHFLYNTLNTILWKSESGEHEDVREMIVSLSKLFRLGLNNGNEITTVRKELEHVTQYLRIQQQCYEDLFDYSIHVEDESILDQPMLKLLLQPLVENSILHGFKDGADNGRIQITIEVEERQLLCTVEDNGKGFDTDAIQQFLTMGEAGKSNGYALRNVYNRLTLYYGKGASMSMESQPMERTVVSLVIPLFGEMDTF
ncbi:sensor histidine kinase [Paenibacillus sp. NPDC093718]|uniref:sensor histidine kinase n=1 Tax=Paenibacillus sp. NPDC093718 TaxID=3390601 RepID=UPI003D0704A4